VKSFFTHHAPGGPGWCWVFLTRMLTLNLFAIASSLLMLLSQNLFYFSNF